MSVTAALRRFDREWKRDVTTPTSGFGAGKSDRGNHCVGIAPDWSHRRTFADFSEFRLIGGSKDYFARLSLLGVYPPDGPRHHERGSHSNNQQ